MTGLMDSSGAGFDTVWLANGSATVVLETAIGYDSQQALSAAILVKFLQYKNLRRPQSKFLAMPPYYINSWIILFLGR